MRKKKNVIKLIMFMLSIGVMVFDLYTLAVKPFITGTLYQWTWLGLVTFILCPIIANNIYEDFEEQIKSIQCNQPKLTTDTNK